MTPPAPPGNARLPDPADGSRRCAGADGQGKGGVPWGSAPRTATWGWRWATAASTGAAFRVLRGPAADEAALRQGRFGELIYIGLPDYAARLWMLRRALAKTLAGAGLAAPELSARTGIDLARRGEDLTVEEFDRIAEALGPGTQETRGAW